MSATNESDRSLGDAEELFKKGKKKEALEKMLDSARASGTDLNYLADEYGLSKSKVPIGGSPTDSQRKEAAKERAIGTAIGGGLLCGFVGCVVGIGSSESALGVLTGFILGALLGAVVFGGLAYIYGYVTGKE